ncbi:hypothetical protein GCM10027446_03720 [Angustibacter peucedani]
MSQYDLVASNQLLSTVVSVALAQIYAETTPSVVEDAPDPGPRRVPRDLRIWLARLRLLEAVPFSHLVADTSLLPAESIRFFHVDRGWTDALVEGALGVGTVTTSDRAVLEQMYPVVRDEVDEAERLVRLPGWTRGAAVPSGPAGPVTGFLLRSRMVSGWPGLHVRAYGKDNLAVSPKVKDRDVDEGDDVRLARLPLLRMERLAPAVLLVLVDGFPQVVHLEEPRSGVQYGIDQEPVPGGYKAKVPLRDVRTGDRVEPEKSADVPFRKGAPGVLHLATLAQRFKAGGDPTHVGTDVDAAEFGIQMLQFPWRAVFGDQTLADPDAAVIELDAMFRPSIAFAELEQRFVQVDP